jgi:uncharacterized protein (DUF4415 family)
MANKRTVLDDDDAPELTPELMKQLRPLKEIDPELDAEIERLQAAKRHGRSQQKAPTKESVTIRYSRHALAAYRATGRGWQTRLAEDVARCAARLRRKSA